MVGEIRDGETAEIAVRSALTGHLVFSTLHTNDAASAVTRLTDMGVEPFLASSVLEAVLAQRLGRRICAHCRTHAEISDAVAHRLTAQELALFTTGRAFKGAGCEKCNQTGYRGRIGYYELLVVTPKMRQAISQRKGAGELLALADNATHRTMRLDGLEKAARGETTIEEVLRSTQDTTEV